MTVSAYTFKYMLILAYLQGASGIDARFVTQI
jgi:hypothetical protein